MKMKVVLMTVKKVRTRNGEERVSDGNSSNGKDVLDDVNKTNEIMSSIRMICKIDEQE